MPLDQFLSSRRSIRSYQSKQVPEEHITSLVNAALTAPSPSNSQPVRYIRISSDPVRDLLKREMEAGFERLVRQADTKIQPKKLKNVIKYYWRHSIFMMDAPALFAVATTGTENSVSARLSKAGLLDDDFNGQTGHGITTGFSLAAFTMKAQALGLGSCILTAPLIFMNDTSFLTDRLTPLPCGDTTLRCFVTIGFADETPDATARLDAAQVLCHA